MKKFQFILVLISFMGLILIGCADKSPSPVAPTDQSPTVSLDKKGPVVHYIKGANLGIVEGKTAGYRINAREYSDGSFDGEYEINSANAFKKLYPELPPLKWNGTVLAIKVHYIEEFKGNMGVILGLEKNGYWASQGETLYDVFFVIENNNGGNNQNSYYVDGYLDITKAKEIFNLSPAELIAWQLLYPAERGNIQVY
jgi:hypothetical protein